MAVPPGPELSRLAESYGVATSYQPSPDRTVAASATAVTLALAALGVDAGDPAAALAARERELRERLLPPTVVCWSGSPPAFGQVNPLHAAVPGAPADPSPYRPSSRRFPDPVHLRIEDIPEYTQIADPDRLRALRERAERLREAVLEKGALIDRDAVWELK